MRHRVLKILIIGAVRGLAALAIVLALFAAIGPQTALAASAINVNTTADENGTGAGCSLREAITTANTNTNFGGCTGAAGGPFTINVPAGTYQLTLANTGGANEDSNATGDLDVLGSLTINGAGSGTTIIEAGTNTSNGIDKVIGANPTCASGLNVTITGVTVRFGRNTQPITDPNFSFTGGGIDWCAGGTGGTFTLSNSVVSDNTNVNGYGGGLNVDTVSSPTTVNITNVTFSNNQTLSTVNTANGGAINLFGDSPTITITNSTFTNNHTTNSTSGGGAIYFRPTTIGSLSISGSTFTSNTAAGIGGAIATDSHGAGTTISIGTSTFSGNTATNSFGGALSLDSTNVNTTPFSLTHLTITGNSAGQAGGGLFIGNSNVTMSKSLIVGNTAPTASGLRKSVDATTVTVTNNWWGCSTGPSASPCDTASTAGGTLNFTPWYRDQLTASTSPIVTNQSTSLTASFLTNSANAAVPLADLAELIGRSVTWAATNGNLSGTQGTVQASGTATGSFQATVAGTAIISAKVDNDNTSPVSSNVLSLTVNKANTTTTITSDTPDPTVTGQSYTVTYSVSATFGVSPTAPTGNVTVSDGTNTCTGTVSAAQCILTSFTVGNKTLTATYAGDSNFNASPASIGVAHTVNKADTTTTISSDTPDPSVVGQAVTFQYSVSVNAPGGGTPTGNVTVSDGGSNSCTGTVAAGQCSITFTSPASKSLTATYAGDSNYNGSTSATEAHQVNKADTTTTITSDNPDPSDVGQAVTMNFTVAAVAPGAGIPTGNVTVTDGVDSCTGTAASGTCNISLTTTGARTLTATYAGDSNFNGSTSAGEPHAVNKFATTTSITSDNPDPSVVGQLVNVQYTVTTASGTPTGNVTVSDGTVFCTASVAAGQCSLTFASAGAKSLTATYAGDSNFNGSTSAAAAHQVNKASTTTTITSDNPDPSAGGQSVTVNYQVTVTAPGAGTPTGNVTVSDGVDNCIGTVAAGSCNITLTTGGARTLTATYASDSNFNGSTSAGEPHFVDNTPPSVTINQAAGQADPTGVSPINFTVIFSKAVTGFTDTDLNLSGTAGATTAVVTGGPTTYNVAVSGMTAAGTVIASIPAGAASDAVGNLNTASTSTDNTVSYNDNVPPTVVSSVRADPNPTSAATVHFTVTFSESVTGVDSSDFGLTTTGLSGSSVSGVSGSGSVYTVTVSVGTGSSGTLRLDVLDDDSIKDAFNNPLGGTGAGNGNFTGGETYTISQVATVQVAISGTSYGPYNIAPQSSQVVNVAGINTGAVNVFSTNTTPIIPAERVIYNVNNAPTSFSEMIGLPKSQLDTIYWMPWYNNMDLDTQLRFANVSLSTATVHVYIAGQEMSGSPFSLAPSGANQGLRVSFPNVNSGPVHIVSNVPIVAAERVIYTINGVPISFSETMGLPASQLDTTYWMPWYNNVDLDTQLRFANVDPNLPATVHVKIGGIEMSGSPFTLAVGASMRVSFAGINNGPVQVVSNVKIVTAERVIYKINNTPISFSEMMGLPDGQSTMTYWMPGYDSVNLDSQLRVANIGSSLATIHVFVGGTEVTGSPFTLAAGAATRVSFAGVNNGPVKIVSNVSIVVAKRVIYNNNNIPTSFSEMMGLPDSQLDTSYWMPWHNNIDLDTKLRISVP